MGHTHLSCWEYATTHAAPCSWTQTGASPRLLGPSGTLCPKKDLGSVPPSWRDPEDPRIFECQTRMKAMSGVHSRARRSGGIATHAIRFPARRELLRMGEHYSEREGHS